MATGLPIVSKSWENVGTWKESLRILAIRAVSSPKVSRGTLGKTKGGQRSKESGPWQSGRSANLLGC